MKWLERPRASGNAAPKPRGGSVSPLEEHMARVLAVVAEQPDLPSRPGGFHPQDRLLRLGAASVHYIPGNHDEFLRDFYGTHFGGIEVVEARHPRAAWTASGFWLFMAICSRW